MMKLIFSLLSAVSSLTMFGQVADTTIVLNYGYEPIDTITISKSSDTFLQIQEAESAIQGIDDDNARSNAAVNYVLSHPDSDGSVFILNHVFGFTKGRKCINALSERVRNGHMKTLYKAYEDGLKEVESYMAKTSEALPLGKEAKDFTLEDSHGGQLSLSSLRGKYVLLDFWASWCGPCIESFPHMKAFYEQHRDKVEVLGVAVHDKKDKWQEAFKRHQLPWSLVLDTEGDDSVANLYGIFGVPTYVLLDPEGKVLQWSLNEFDNIEECYYDHTNKNM